MTDRQTLHKMLDELLDAGRTTGTNSVYISGSPGETPAIQKTYHLKFKIDVVGLES